MARSQNIKKSNSLDLDAVCKKFMVPPNAKITLTKYHTAVNLAGVTKEDLAVELLEGAKNLADEQSKLYAQNTYSLLVVLQAMDAAGKDSTIKHVMSGVNPQGCQVYSFKAPNSEEMDHDYLWRCMRLLPERGNIGVFNRSYYEEVLVARVHPEILEKQQLPPELKDKGIWKRRYREINNFEQYLVDNGIIVLKFFLNVSKDEQRQRFLRRIDRPEKNWKFEASDARERGFWDDYQKAYEQCLSATSTDWAPWYVIPADHKPFMRLAVAHLIQSKLKSLELRYPEINKKQHEQLLLAKKVLLEEK